MGKIVCPFPEAALTVKGGTVMANSQAAPVTIQAHRYLGWDAWRIQRGPLDVVLTPQVGGRIMRLAWQGEDLIFTHPEFHGRVEPVADMRDIHSAKQQMGFRLWGGEKTWLSPQPRWTDGVPFLDLDSGHYTLDTLFQTPDRVCVRMTSPVCRETGMQLTRTLNVGADDNGIEIIHELYNTTSQPAEWGLWSVAQLLKPAHVYLPRRRESRYPAGVKTFVEEGASSHVRPQVVQEVETLVRIACQGDDAFKFGVDATEGWLLAICDRSNSGPIAYLTTFAVHPDQPYGHGCVAEVFNSDQLPYLEAEVHSPLLQLAPGARATFQETRTIIALEHMPQTESDVRRLLR